MKASRKKSPPPLLNQQLRTRKDILQAAARLLQAGKKISMDEVAKEALVSRATAYRYFSDVDALMTEVVIDRSVPDAKEIFLGKEIKEVTERVDYAETVMHDFVYANEAQLRLLLARSLSRQKDVRAGDESVSRQNRRTDYIHEALLPFREQFSQKTYKKLCASLALIFGPEAMIVFRDVLPLEAGQAKDVKRWMLSVLIQAALKER